MSGAPPTVAALYVDPTGVYAGLPGVEVWDEARDARRYAGPWPVVAHPPCARWSVLWPLVKAATGIEPGDDGGCFAAALAAVRRFGGVLEHPAQSLAWTRFALPRPGREGWTSSLTDPGMTTEVSQAAYGHRARKRTWLYYVGSAPLPLQWGEPRTAAKVSGFKHLATGEYVADESRRVRSREAASTPPAFRDVLLAMARSAAGAVDE
jgi:hypothetical protein